MKRLRSLALHFEDYKKSEIDLIRRTLKDKFGVEFEIKRIKNKDKTTTFQAITKGKTKEVIAEGTNKEVLRAKDQMVEKLGKCYDAFLHKKNLTAA